jgi:hypothetical protein
METSAKILKFMFCLILKLFFASLVHYVIRPIWSSSGASKIAVLKLLHLNKIPKYSFVFALICCCTSVVLGVSSCLLCAAIF